MPHTLGTRKESGIEVFALFNRSTELRNHEDAGIDVSLERVMVRHVACVTDQEGNCNLEVNLSMSRMVDPINQLIPDYDRGSSSQEQNPLPCGSQDVRPTLNHRDHPSHSLEPIHPSLEPHRRLQGGAERNSSMSAPPLPPLHCLLGSGSVQ